VVGDQFDLKAGVIRPYKDLSPEEQATYWLGVEPYLDIPGMREHYPETAAAYDEWAAHYDDPVEPVMAPTAPVMMEM